jgi:uncharacterized membrane protein YgdD (TMEM256/DUF423 family)
MNKKIIITGLIFGFIAIILGAFGAHALKKILSVEQLNSFEVGQKYLMYHALFLLFVGSTKMVDEARKKTVFYLILIGTILFSGSIFLLTTSAISNIDFKFIGPVTPIGGLLLLGGWFWLIVNIFNKK